MNKLFNNILVPIDFSAVSKLAVEKAVDIANHFNCNIHLVVVEANKISVKTGQSSKSVPSDKSVQSEKSIQSDKSFQSDKSSQSDKNVKGWEFATDAEAKLSRFQTKLTSRLKPGLCIYSYVLKGNRNRAVIEYALRNNIDLVIIGRLTGFIRNLINGGFRINEITKQIECPVLTVRKDAHDDRWINTTNNQWMNIVLPVCSKLPLRKIMFASYLARKYNSKIHLLAIAGNEKDTGTDRNQYLNKAYQLIRDNTDLTVECHIIRGNNIADTTLQFARKINADLIVVNPGKESRLSGFVNKLIHGSLFTESRIPVLTISAV